MVSVPPPISAAEPGRKQRTSSQRYCATQALTRLMQIVSARDAKRSRRRCIDRFRIIKLPWWPMGVRKAVPHQVRCQTMNGCGGNPSARASASEIARQHGRRASERICVTSAASPVQRQHHARGLQRRLSPGVAAPGRRRWAVLSMARPSGITPAIITKMRTSISR